MVRNWLSMRPEDFDLGLLCRNQFQLRQETVCRELCSSCKEEIDRENTPVDSGELEVTIPLSRTVVVSLMINYDRVEELDNWLDNNVGQLYKEAPLAQDWARISKVAEELGEAIQAFIGVTGQNPRKGITHANADVLKELADTVATGILAIQHFTKDKQLTQIWVEQHLDYLHKRVLGDKKSDRTA